MKKDVLEEIVKLCESIMNGEEVPCECEFDVAGQVLTIINNYTDHFTK